MKYLVSMINSQGRTRLKTVEAGSCKEAERIASERFPSYEIVRVSNDADALDFYKTWGVNNKDK